VAPISGASAELRRAERINARLGHENLGSLGSEFGFVPARPPQQRLPSSHRRWDDIAAQVPQLYSDLAVRTALQRMPVLPADSSALPDSSLLRAATVLGVLGHSYVHMLTTADPELPASIAVPWAEVRRRLGRGPDPVLSYADLVVNNWRIVDPGQTPAHRVANLQLLVPAIDNPEEHVFYLTQLEILVRCAAVVASVARAQDAVNNGRSEELWDALGTIESTLAEVNTQSLRLIDPRPRSSTFVDPVIWAKTVAPFAVPSRPGILGPSGTASPIVNLLDAFFGRDRHASQLGQEILAHRRSYPPHWRRFIRAVGQLSVGEYLNRQAGRELVDRYAAAQQAYAGPDGFLGRHRRKVYGYLAVGFTVGRAVTIGGFSGAPQQHRWDDVDTALSASQSERPAPSTDQAPMPPSSGSPQPARPPGRRIHLADLLDHNDAERGWWIAVDGRVYDVSAFVLRHPGGSAILRAHAGLDATAAFARAHREPTGMGHLRDRLSIGYLEHPRETRQNSARLHAANALVELQNTFQLDRSFGQGTVLCGPAGSAASALQIDRAADTFQRFRHGYLPELAASLLRHVPGLQSVYLPVDLSPERPQATTEDRAKTLRRQLDGVEQWMARVKSVLLADLRSASDPELAAS
jgi:cytochrome b involved in lipid metabolism